MTTLVIHPKDQTTDFLKPIYQDLPNLSVITGGINHDTLNNLIELYDQILFMGHGSPNGLFSMGQFDYRSIYIVDERVVDTLRSKDRVLYLWCNADQFVRRHNLNGMFSGMFISEMGEARYCGVTANLTHVNESNDTFAALLGESLKSNGSLTQVWNEVMGLYSAMAEKNPVAKYNSERWYVTSPTKNLVI